VLILLFFGVLMGALDLAIVGPALPAMQKEFGMDNRELSWLFNIYVLFQLVGAPLLAKMSDRFGRRAVYIFSIGCFALGSVLLVVAPVTSMLMIGRAVQGFGAGGIFPVAAAVIGDTFPAEKRGGALGLLGAVFGIAFLIGPILGGILLQWAWQWLFLINLPIALVLVIFAWRLLPAESGEIAKPFDWKGATTLSAALACLAVAVTNIDSSDLAASVTSTSVLPYLIGLIVLTPIFWQFEKRAADPMVRTTFFSSLQIRLTVMIALGVGTIESGSVFFPALAVAALGVTESNAAWLILPSVLATTVASPIVGKILDHVGSKLIVQLGLALTMAGILIYGLVNLSITWFIVGGVIGGIGLAGLLGAPLRYILLNEAEKQERASAQALLTIFLAIGQLLGAAIVGSVAASRGGGAVGYQAAFLTLGTLTALLLGVSFALKSRSRELADAAAAGEVY
jgi:multidrug resistance protein